MEKQKPNSRMMDITKCNMSNAVVELTIEIVKRRRRGNKCLLGMYQEDRTGKTTSKQIKSLKTIIKSDTQTINYLTRWLGCFN